MSYLRPRPAPFSIHATVLLAALLTLLLTIAPPAWGDDVPDDPEGNGTEEGMSEGAGDEDVDDDDGPALLPYYEDTAERAYNPAVLALATEGVLLGCEPLRFCPDGEVTRGQLATMLVNALGLPPAEERHYTDIAGNIHAESIDAVAAAGITAGCASGRFCAEDTLTRDQFATMLVGAFDLPSTDVRHFDGLSSTHGDNVNRLAEARITNGCTEPLTSFCGDDDVLRWHAASFLARAMGFVEGVDITPLEERRAEQERIDAEREAEREAQRQAEEEARRAAEEAAAAADPWGIASLSDARVRMWERLAQCESNGNESAVSGNGLYYGWLQFHPQTWHSVGGTGLPNQATWQEHIYRAERLLEKPWATMSNQWPACSRMLGIG